MARSKGTGRGSRYGQRGVFSAATFATIPSGCTMATGSFQTPTGYGISGATAGIIFRHGIADGANNKSPGGASLSVTHGITTLYGFNAILYYGGLVSADVSRVIVTAQTGTTKGIWTFNSAGAPATSANGVSVHWTAFGI